MEREWQYFAKKSSTYVSYFFVTDSGGHPQGGSIQCGSKRRVALQFVIASVTSSVITLRARCQGNSCNCPGLGTRIPHATFYTIYYTCQPLYILYQPLYCGPATYHAQIHMVKDKINYTAPTFKIVSSMNIKNICILNYDIGR